MKNITNILENVKINQYKHDFESVSKLSRQAIQLLRENPRTLLEINDFNLASESFLFMLPNLETNDVSEKHLLIMLSYFFSSKQFEKTNDLGMIMSRILVLSNNYDTFSSFIEKYIKKYPFYFNNFKYSNFRIAPLMIISDLEKHPLIIKEFPYFIDVKKKLYEEINEEYIEPKKDIIKFGDIFSKKLLTHLNNTFINFKDTMGLIQISDKFNPSDFDRIKNELNEKRVSRYDDLSNLQLEEILNLLNEILYLIEKYNIEISQVSKRSYYLDRADVYFFLNRTTKTKTLWEKSLRDYEMALPEMSEITPELEFHFLKSMEGISWTKARLGMYKDALIDSHELICYGYENIFLISKFFIVRGSCYRELGMHDFAEKDFFISNLPESQIKPYLNQNGDPSFKFMEKRNNY